ncbi:MAG TPA: hypothetical protein VF525_16550 [Pyrinomonadaceae bacterium]
MLSLICALLCAPQTPAPAEVAAGVIAEYKTADALAQVSVWQKQLTHPDGNPQFKEYRDARLKEFAATEFAPYRLYNPALAAQVRAVLLPVLRLYGRQDGFDIIVIDSPVPVMMNDSAVLLMVSTGLLERATSDDELLGHVAHELGHDLHWRRTASARAIKARHEAAGTPGAPEAVAARADLARIELECDAFSAVTLAALGRNPLPFACFLEATARDFPDYLDPDLPPVSLRVKVMTAVVPVAARGGAVQISAEFKQLKARLALRKNMK